MNIQLASGVFAERVGDTVVLLNSRTHQVYSLPTGIVADVSGNTLLMSPLATPDHIHDLAKHQLIDLPPAAISRRGFLGLTTAVVGGGLVAMGLPTVATASSGSGKSRPSIEGMWEPIGATKVGDTILAVTLLISLDPDDFPDSFGPPNTWTITVFGESFAGAYVPSDEWFQIQFTGGSSLAQIVPLYEAVADNGAAPGTVELLATVSDGSTSQEVLLLNGLVDP